MTHEVMGSSNKKYPLILWNSIVSISNTVVKCDQLVKPKIRVRKSTQLLFFYVNKTWQPGLSWYTETQNRFYCDYCLFFGIWADCPLPNKMAGKTKPANDTLLD